jgi:hypothetical protein
MDENVPGSIDRENPLRIPSLFPFILRTLPNWGSDLFPGHFRGIIPTLLLIL